MKLQTKFSSLFAAVTATAIASSASAASINLAYLSINPGIKETVSTNSGSTFTDYLSGQQTYGVSNNVGATSVLPSTGNLSAFCLEVAGGISTNPNTFQVLGPTLGFAAF